MTDWGQWFGQATLWLAVLALVLACFQTWEARKQSTRLKAHSDALVLITGSLSTRYLGKFPDYLPVVSDLVRSARIELRIVNGNPTPGYFSSPSTWLDYKQALEKKVRSGVVVSLICMNDRQRRQRLEQQFPTSQQGWDDWVIANCAKVVEFLKFRFPDTKLEELDYSKFLDLLQMTQRDILKDSFKLNGISVLEIDQTVLVQVWIADKERAVFSIQSLQANTLSHGLFTSDPLFVSALHSMIELYATQRSDPPLVRP